jgi:phosphoribosylformylglycinamidine (FGAM) synthase-like amidotransferase family enzyme
MAAAFAEFADVRSPSGFSFGDHLEGGTGVVQIWIYMNTSVPPLKVAA